MSLYLAVPLLALLTMDVVLNLMWLHSIHTILKSAREVRVLQDEVRALHRVAGIDNPHNGGD